MSYHKLNQHEGVKRCPECRHDTMRYDSFADAWCCFNVECGNRIREEFFQSVLPSTKELEADDIAPDNLKRSREKLYIKSFTPGSYNDYEDSLDLNLSYSNKIYKGSAQSALEQDKIQFQHELDKEKRVNYSIDDYSCMSSLR